MELTVIFLVVLSAVFVGLGVKRVPQGYEWTVERFGRYTQTLTPGLHFIFPIIDVVGHKQNVMEQILDVPAQEIISADNAMITTDAVCFYQIIDPVKASYEINNLKRSLENIVMTNVRAVLGSMTLDSMLSERDAINVQLQSKLDSSVAVWGVKCTRVELKDINPPKDLVDAMANQMKAERNKRATILNAQGHREAEVEVAEGEKLAAILKAEGAREAAFKEAEGRERLAEAEARATESVSKAISEGSNSAINYFVAQKYIEALGKIASAENSKVIMMPLEASGVIGSVAGINDLIKEMKS